MYTFKEFRANMSKILRELGEESAHFTRLGVEYEVKKCAQSAKSKEKVCTNPQEVRTLADVMAKKSVRELVEEDIKKVTLGVPYGCGCKKEESKHLCPKHGRL